MRWGLLALCLVGVGVLGLQYYRLRSAMQWEGPVPEILSETFDKHANTVDIALSSRIDAPVEAVLRAFAEPERSQEFSDAVQHSKLLRESGNRKVVAFEMVVLGRLQHFTLEFTFLPDENRVTVQTLESQVNDISGEYHFIPSPDGTKTLLTYTGTSRNKVDIPIPFTFQKNALRETFAATVRALKRVLAMQQKTLRQEM